MAISSALVARCEREREYEMQVIPLENLVSAVSETLKEAGAKNAKAIAAFQDKVSFFGTQPAQPQIQFRFSGFGSIRFLTTDR